MAGLANRRYAFRQTLRSPHHGPPWNWTQLWRKTEQKQLRAAAVPRIDQVAKPGRAIERDGGDSRGDGAGCQRGAVALPGSCAALAGLGWC